MISESVVKNIFTYLYSEYSTKLKVSLKIHLFRNILISIQLIILKNL